MSSPTLVGNRLFELGRKLALTSTDIEIIDQVRDKIPAEPMRFANASDANNVNDISV